MEILLIINLIITVLYLTISCLKTKQIPESISETSYIWESECKDKGLWHTAYIFSIYCFITATLLFFPWLFQTPILFQFLSFLGCVGIIIAGLTPFFKEDYKGYIHYGGGMLALICWLVWMCVMSYWIPLLICILVFTILTLLKKDSYTFWAEVVGLITLFLILY